MSGLNGLRTNDLPRWGLVKRTRLLVVPADGLDRLMSGSLWTRIDVCQNETARCGRVPAPKPAFGHFSRWPFVSPQKHRRGPRGGLAPRGSPFSFPLHDTQKGYSERAAPSTYIFSGLTGLRMKPSKRAPALLRTPDINHYDSNSMIICAGVLPSVRFEKGLIIYIHTHTRVCRL